VFLNVPYKQQIPALVTSGNDLWYSLSSQSSGISLAPADDVLRGHLKLPKDQGLVVTALDPNCSAAQAGIQQNDILLRLDATPLAKPDDFVARLKEIGEKPLNLSVLRGGEVRVLRVQPKIRVTLEPVQPTPPPREFWIGASVVPVDPTLRLQLRISPGQGLLVNEVVKDGPAEKAGLKRHDILMELDGKPLSDVARFAEEVQAHGATSMALKLIREGRRNLLLAVIPVRRKTTAPVQAGDQKPYSFVAVQPGAVLMDYNDKGIYSLGTSANGGVNLVPPSDGTWYFAHDGSTSVASRLDALDAELKALRKAVEELSKAARSGPRDK
jgi:S1-C subfamily serine protease